MLGPHPFHTVGEKYIRAVTAAASAVPVLLPALGDALDPDQVLDGIDGVLLTGSPSNVAPERYGEVLRDTSSPLDAARDASTLPLITRALARGIPLLGICRGFQEINVALGGSLWQAVHEQPGMLDHREDKAAPLDVQYGPAHAVELRADGVMRRLADARVVTVNSLHGQGVRQLAPGLEVEAHAPDGLIEAFRVRGGGEFALAVQWHPEWQVLQNPFFSALFAAFGAACAAHAQRKVNHAH